MRIRLFLATDMPSFEVVNLANRRSECPATEGASNSSF
jgi:hypothetical protein